jgi:folylpolyglutamate synthase/dihydropteroate synthase
MSFSTLSTVAVGLAFLAMTVAVIAGILVCLRRRERANRALALAVVLFAAATATAFGAAARSGNDLQVETHAVLALAASAERTAHARYGRYTTSIARLERISPALADQLSLDAAHVSAGARALTRRVRLRAWIGASTPASLELRFGAR